MKTKLPWILAILLAIALVVVLFARPTTKPSGTSAANGGPRKVLYWIDSMNPGHKSDKPGKAPDGMDLVPVYADEAQAAVAPAVKKVLYWVDPMHPAYKSDKPGIAPDCGMTLVPVYAEGGEPATSTVAGYSNVKLSAERKQLSSPRYRLLLPEDEAEVERLYQLLKTVGHLDPKNTGDEK